MFYYERVINRGRKGWRNEHKTMEWYRKHHGCSCIRAGGSKGVWDIVAWNGTNVFFIQQKSNQWPGSEEMQRIQDAVVPPFAHKHVVRWDDHAREPKFRYV